MQWYRIGSRESYFCLFATVGPFLLEMSGRETVGSWAKPTVNVIMPV